MSPETPHEAEVLLGKLTRREFRERMTAGQLNACIIPVAAIEQHLEHLAMEHDWRSVNEVAQAAAHRLNSRVIVAQGLMCGISEHHMKHPGTLTLKPGSFLAVLYDLVDSMVRAGFQNVLVLNGHGGNVAPCQGVWGQFQQLSGVNLHFVSYWDLIDREAALAAMQSDALPGHAQEFETALGLAAFAENVRCEMWTDQKDQSPSLATAQTGQILLELATTGVTDYLRDMIEGRRLAEIPPFFE